tara:strand:- start:800 stop:1426 length:627 start_codon:yes stop_codon:yes gene_type:complete
MIGALFGALKSPIGQGLLGLGMNRAGSRDMRRAATPMSYAQASQPFQQSQDLINRMTNFNRYSGGAMDLAAQAGNRGVQTAMMMGQGGSQANAIRQRIQNTGMNQAYQAFQENLGQAAGLQSDIDRQIAGKMYGDDAYQREYRMREGSMQRDAGMGLMGDALVGLRAPGGMEQAGLDIGNVLSGAGNVLSTGATGLLNLGRGAYNFFS